MTSRTSIRRTSTDLASPVRILTYALVLLAAAARAAPEVVWRRVRGDRAGARAAVGRALAGAAERLGPAAVKVAQIAAARRDLLPSELTDALARLHDEVSTPQTAVLLKALAEAYAEPLEALFADIEPTPVAAGSVAVVFRGRTTDGQRVAIKLVRPGVARLIDTDLALMARLAGMVEQRPSLAHIPLRETLRLVADQVRRQCDMEAEADASERFRLLHAGALSTPTVRRDLTRPQVLVSEWLDGGVRISDLSLASGAYETACRTLLRVLYAMIFRDGVVHLDLHPGNVRVDPTGAVTLYDYGLTAEISGPDRDCFRGLMNAVAEADPQAAARHLIASSTATGPVDRRRLHTDLTAMLRRYAGKPAGEFLVMGLVGDLFDLQRRHGLCGAPGFANAVWALGLYEGLVRHRFPKLDFQGELKRFELGRFIDQVQARRWGR